MKEGEPVLGGPQVAPGSTPISNVGPQPAASGTSPTPRSDFSSFQSGPQPSTGPSLTSTQPNPSVSPTTPQSIPRLTNRFSDRPTSTGSPQTSYINSNPPNMQYTGPAPVQPPMQYQPQMIASNNTGDIVLSSPAPKKSKKGLVATLIFFILILAGGLVAYSFFRNNNNVATLVNNDDIKISFNIYANYLLFEEDSTNSPTADSWSNDKILENLSLAENKSTAYFTNVLDLFNEFSEKIKIKNASSNAENPEDSEDYMIGSLANNTSSALGALKLYSEINRYSTVDMVEIFLSQGGEKLVEIVKNSYSGLASSEYLQLQEYAELEIKIADLIVEVYTEYANAGCISNGAITSNCPNSAVFSQSYADNRATLDNYVSTLGDIEYHITNDAISLSKTIYGELNYMEENE